MAPQYRLVQLSSSVKVPPLLRGHYANLVAQDTDGLCKIVLLAWSVHPHMQVPASFIAPCDPEVEARFRHYGMPDQWRACSDEVQTQIARFNESLNKLKTHLGAGVLKPGVWQAETARDLTPFSTWPMTAGEAEVALESVWQEAVMNSQRLMRSVSLWLQR